MLTRLVAPASYPISLAEAKQNIRRPDSEEDAFWLGLIAEATDVFDGKDGRLRRALITQTWQLTLPCFTSDIRLPLPPIQSVERVAYMDGDGVEQVLDSAEYRLAGEFLDPVSSWPSAAVRRDAVRIDFVAGYGDWSDVPEGIRKLLQAWVAYLDRNRGDENVAEPQIIASLTRQYSVPTL